MPSRTGTKTRPLFRLALALCLVTVLPLRAAAWGGAGHRIIAHVAAQNLSPAAERAVVALLGKESLAAASTYADEVRLFRPETTAWHFVEMPRNAKAYVPARDCAYTSRGDCAVNAILRLDKLLRADAGETSGKTAMAVRRGAGGAETKADALKFLVHLVADIHQPLHCGYKDDAGGNRVRVRFVTTDTNLHALWDSTLLAVAQQAAAPGRGLDETDYAAKRLLARLGEIPRVMRAGDAEKARSLLARLDPARMKNAAPEDWAFESYLLAARITEDVCRRAAQPAADPLRKGAPAKPSAKQQPPIRVLLKTAAQSNTPAPPCAERSALRPIPLNINYYDTYEKELDEQLLWAGVRLALLLNHVFEDSVGK